MLFKGFSIICSGNYFVHLSRTILAILVKGNKRNTYCIFSSGGHFVRLSGTFVAILVEGHKRSISVRLF